MGADLVHAVAAAEFSGVTLSTGQQEQLVAFHDWLGDEGQRAGGIGPDERDRLWDRHIADSLVFIAALSEHPVRCLDIGSGVGLPGIPIAVALPHTQLILLDRSGRRCDLLRRVVSILRLNNCEVVHDDIAAFDETVDAIVSRAAMPIDSLMIHVKRLLEPQGSAAIALSRTGGGANPAKIPTGLVTSVVSVPATVLDSGANLLRIEAT